MESFPRIIRPIATASPNFWRWQLIDFAFGIVSAGLAYFGLNFAVSKLLPGVKRRLLITIPGTILLTTLAVIAGEQYGNISAFKGSPLDIPDWIAELGGLCTFFTAEWFHGLILKRGITVGELLSKLFPRVGPKMRSAFYTAMFYSGIATVGFVASVSLVYLLKLLGVG